MRRFTLAAVLAGVGLVVSAATADAQTVIGTRYTPGTVVSPYGVIPPQAPTVGTPYTTGYYSPYPGTLYSPFATGNYGGYRGGIVYPYAGYTYRSRYYTSPPGGVMRGRSAYPRW